MNAPTESRPLTLTADDLLEAMSIIFESLGRGLLCLDRRFNVVHASASLNDLVCEGAADCIHGRPAHEVLGPELFGPTGTLKRALEAGKRREGWGASLKAGESKPLLVSITAAPVLHEPGTPCDPRVAYLVVVRPAHDPREAGSESLTIFSGMVARSRSMLQIFRLIEQLHESEATVLISGESGTGKELIARAVHVHSPRHAGRFVAVNCGALPGELLESELFGHVRGAFTGAVKDRVGRFELASGGTLFLDEVGDLPLNLQVKLLRVLQEKTFERVGESTPRQTDARVIAATNQNLRQAVRAGGFRDDLYFRLRVVPVEVPPLRQRREDIEPLARHLLDRLGRRHGRSTLLSPDALRKLLRHDWPGNVRELENALEYALAICQGQTILPHDLPQEIGEPASEPGAERPTSPIAALGSPPGRAGEPAGAAAAELERIRRALEANRWNRSATARALGISRTTLWRKMRELGLLR